MGFFYVPTCPSKHVLSTVCGNLIILENKYLLVLISKYSSLFLKAPQFGKKTMFTLNREILFPPCFGVLINIAQSIFRHISPGTTFLLIMREHELH